MRESILYSNRAVNLFQKMGNNYGLGFALANLGKAQLRLAHYTEDDQLLHQSRESLKKSQELVPQSQDAELWAKNELYLGLCQEFLGAKTFDAPTLQEASDIYKRLRSLYDRNTRKPMWEELCNFQAEVEILLGNLDCDSKREDLVLKMLGDIRSENGFQKDEIRAEELDESLGKALNHKGVKEKDSKSMRDGVSLLEEALTIANQGNIESLKCSCLSELLLAYSNLLQLVPDASLAARAKDYLETFKKGCASSPVPMNEASHEINMAKLERSLGTFEKDKSWLLKARPQAASAFKIYQAHHYVFFAATARLELGNEDYLLGQMTGDSTAYQRAFEEFKASEKTFKTYGVCWEKDLKDKIRKSKDFSKK